MVSDESQFNSLIVRGKVTRQCPQTTVIFLRERRAKAKSNRGLSAYQPITPDRQAKPADDSSQKRVSSLLTTYCPATRLQPSRPDGWPPTPVVLSLVALRTCGQWVCWVHVHYSCSKSGRYSRTSSPLDRCPRSGRCRRPGLSDLKMKGTNNS